MRRFPQGCGRGGGSVTTAFVLPGGASLGAVQAGMAEVLIGAGITPDLIVGTSVGALNGAWLASHRGPKGAAELCDVWLGVHRRDIFPFSPVRIMLGLAGRRDHMVSSSALARWLSVRAPFFQLEQAPVPIHVMATDLLSGKAVRLSTGDAIEALLATTAIPGVFPPVEIGGRMLVDGGLAANTPISQAVELGADTVYVLPNVGTHSGGRPRSAPGVSFQAIAHLLGQADETEIAANAGRCHLFVVPPPGSGGISPFDFGHTRQLLDAGSHATRVWLDAGRPIPAGEI
jgi:NTE family protein